MLTRHLRQAFQSPLPFLAGGFHHWRRHGARIRRARLLCECGDGLRLRHSTGWEQRSRRIYLRSLKTLGDLAGAGPSPELDPALAAHHALHEATAQYRGFLSGLARIALFLVLALLVALGIASVISPSLRARIFPPDLAAGRPWTASSSQDGMPASGTDPRSDGRYFFHTQWSENPSVEIDLGGEHTLRSLRVENRADCCQERALPLNVEIWKDGAWRLIAQRRAAFNVWSYDLAPVRASRIRFLRPGTTYLHLRQISVYGQ